MGITDTEQGFVLQVDILGYMDVELDEVLVTYKTYNSDDVSEILMEVQTLTYFRRIMIKML